MKNLIRIFSLLFLMVVIYNHTFAVSSSNISSSKSAIINASDFDETEIYNAFSEIEHLMKVVSENDSATYSDVQLQDSSLLLLVDNESDMASTQNQKFTFNKQTAYLSGCIFGSIGIALVAIINNGDKERLKNAVWGCATNGCVASSALVASYLILFYLGYFLVLLY